MLKDKILELCQLNKMTVKKLTIELGFSEQSIYRWFKEDNLQLKDLKKIAEYFNKDIGYFFGKERSNYKSLSQGPNILNETKGDYLMKDKYISVLEENARLHQEICALNRELQKCLSEIDACKTKQPV
jgi:transcriptional regulator with XRE-family HTH domain